jgi:pilus assembly protein CpaD
MTRQNAHVRPTVFGANISRTLHRGLILAVMPLMLAGCRHLDAGTQVAGWSVVEPSQRHPILVSQQPAQLNISVPAGSYGLSAMQKGSVMDFAARFRSGEAADSRLVIAVPSGGANEVAAMDAAHDIRSLLVESGFNESAIAVEAYYGERSANPPVRLSYLSYVAQGPDCGLEWTENLAKNYNNMPAPNHGCAQQRNLAAMIANPADLLGPRTSTPRYGERRDVVMDNWLQGKTTGSDKSDDERVQVRGAK